MIKKSYCWSLIAAVLLLSTQIIAVIIYIYSFIPYPAIWNDPFSKGVEPKRDPIFYGSFLLMSVLLMAVAVKWILPRLDSSEIRRKFKCWLALESVWVFLMVFCFFKWITYKYPFWNILPYENAAWLVPFFWVVCGLAVLSKIFFVEIEGFYRHVKDFGGAGDFHFGYGIALQVIFILGLVLLLYIPRPQDVAALALAWDQWNHLDQVAGWFIKNGWMIGYDQTIQLLVTAAILYIIGVFYFIRLWLGSWLLAVTGALLTVKMGLFYYGVSPCVWINPSNTFLAHGWDIILFFAFWFVSARYSGKFYAVAVLTAAILVIVWFKSGGFIDGAGFDNQPLMAPLRVRQFFPYFMGFFVPVFYVFSLLVLMGQGSVRKDGGLRLPAAMAVYGLMIFIDYLEHPATGYYGSLMVPAILLALWWLKEFVSPASLLTQRGTYAAVLLVVLGALLTNRIMLIYPDSINQSNDRFIQEKNFAGHFEAIDGPAAMVRQLTPEGQKVPLLSNFETAILIKARRQSLFNDFPLMSSSLNSSPGGLVLRTKEQALNVINSLAQENALYVFVDTRLLGLSSQVLGNSGLGAVLGYVNNHYKVYASRGFLVAMQRR